MTATRRTRVLIVDDHQMVREDLKPLYEPPGPRIPGGDDPEPGA